MAEVRRPCANVADYRSATSTPTGTVLQMVGVPDESHRAGGSVSGEPDCRSVSAEHVRARDVEHVALSIAYVSPVEREAVYAHAIAQRGGVAWIPASRELGRFTSL